MFRTDLIVPIEWRGEQVDAITIERLTDAQIAEIHALRRIKSSRKVARLAVSIAAECPIGLVQKLYDPDFARAADMVARAIDAEAGRLP